METNRRDAPAPVAYTREIVGTRLNVARSDSRQAAIDEADNILRDIAKRGLSVNQQGYVATLIGNRFGSYGDLKEEARYLARAAILLVQDRRSPEALEVVELSNNGERWTYEERGDVLRGLRAQERMMEQSSRFHEVPLDGSQSLVVRFHEADRLMTARGYHPNTPEQRMENAYRMRPHAPTIVHS